MEVARLYLGMNMGQVLDWIYHLKNICPQAVIYAWDFYSDSGTPSTNGVLGSDLLIRVYKDVGQSETEKCLKGFPTEDTPQIQTIYFFLPNGLLGFWSIIFKKEDMKRFNYIDSQLNRLKSQFSGSVQVYKRGEEREKRIYVCFPVAPDVSVEVYTALRSSLAFMDYDCNQGPFYFEGK